jgi:trehalose synthase
MSGLELVPVTHRPVAPLVDAVGAGRLSRLDGRARQMRERIGDRVVWHVNLTASGGGVAEMLHALLGYVLDLGVDTRWLAIGGDAGFFELTKRLHNRLHGLANGPELDAADVARYRSVSGSIAIELRERVRPGDLVVLHDPQTAGLAGALADHGTTVVWRCHIGVDTPTPVTEAAWDFLRPHLAPVQAGVFSRAAYVPDFLADRSAVIPPSIDPFAPKNIALDAATVAAAMDTVADKARVRADRRPRPDEPIMLQVSRWDRLKDMAGVMAAFASHIAPAGPGYLVLAGPAVEGVSDDPEGAEVYGECRDAWDALPADVRERVMLANLPMADRQENALMVNALQRHATVVVQKSLAEGFGLTVAEAMWKSRPVVGSRVGGIADQITRDSGTLVPPGDPAAFGAAVRHFLDNPDIARNVGAAAHQRVCEAFLPDSQLLRWADLFDAVLT